MNILYYLSAFPKLSESFILNEVYELDRRGHSVVVCACRQTDESVVHEEYEQLEIPVHYIDNPTKGDLPELLSRVAISQRVLSGTGYDASLKDRIARLIQARWCVGMLNALDWEPDHVHSHFASKKRFTARHVADYYGASFTLTTHAYDLYKDPVGASTGDLLRAADRVVTISEYNRRYIRERFTDETPVDIVRAGIRPEKFEPTAGCVPGRVFTVSRFVEKKGLRYALEAVALAAQQVDIEYHIVGSGDLEADLRERVDSLGLNDCVSFLDNVSDERLVTEFDEACCFLLPCVVAESGDRDGIPVALMEAMAMETPPVTTTVSGIPELVDHETSGLLTEPRDPGATADALVRLLEDDDLRTAYGARARENVTEEFNITHEAAKLEATFEAAREPRHR